MNVSGVIQQPSLLLAPKSDLVQLLNARYFRTDLALSLPEFRFAAHAQCFAVVDEQIVVTVLEAVIQFLIVAVTLHHGRCFLSQAVKATKEQREPIPTRLTPVKQPIFASGRPDLL